MEQHTIKHFSFNTITHNVSFPPSEGLVAVFFRCPYQVRRVFLCFTPDKAIIVLFTLELVAGLAGGFTLSYVIYQPQIQGLRNDVITLNKAIADKFTDYQAALDNLNTTIQSKLNTTENAPSQENTNQSTSNTPPLNLVKNVGVQNLAATKNGANSDISFNLKNTGTVRCFGRSFLEWNLTAKRSRLEPHLRALPLFKMGKGLSLHKIAKTTPESILI